MNIQSVQYHKASNNKPITNNNLLNNKFKPNFGSYGSGSPVFGTVWVWSAKKLNILGRTNSEMKDLAEYLHKSSNDELEEITWASRWFLSTSKYNETISKLKRFIEPIKDAKLKMVKRISELEIKKALGISNETEQKTRLNREFISLIEAEKKGQEPPIKNGILVHGSSSNKDGFINWLTESAGAVVKIIQHDSNKPTQTTDTLIDIAENAERAFKHSRTRTVVLIKDLDKMLSDKNSADAMDNINEFKSIAEDLSKKYHTTIITKTDKPLDVFEPATIASNRLGLHIDLKDGISEGELTELGSLKAEVERLDDKANNKGILKKEKFTIRLET